MVGGIGHTGGLTNPLPWRGRCQAGYKNRALFQKKDLKIGLAGNMSRWFGNPVDLRMWPLVEQQDETKNSLDFCSSRRCLHKASLLCTTRKRSKPTEQTLSWLGFFSISNQVINVAKNVAFDRANTRILLFSESRLVFGWLPVQIFLRPPVVLLSYDSRSTLIRLDRRKIFGRVTWCWNKILHSLATI